MLCAGTLVAIDLLIIAVWMTVDPPSGVVLPSRMLTCFVTVAVVSQFSLRVCLCLSVQIHSQRCHYFVCGVRYAKHNAVVARVYGTKKYDACVRRVPRL